jgi:hypothetical protein
MRRLALVLCCAASAAAAQQTRARVGLPGYRDLFPIEDVTIPFTLNAPVGPSFAAVRAAFEELKVPVTVDDSVVRLIGNMKLPASGTLSGYRLSRLFDCGLRAMGGPNADAFRLTIVFLALLDTEDATHTKLRVGLVAGGEPVGGARRDAVQCGSTGVLEARLVALATVHLK